MRLKMAVMPDGHVVVALSGEFDIATAPAVRDLLAELASATVTGITVDLGGLTFVDAAGLRVLADASRAAREPTSARSGRPARGRHGTTRRSRVKMGSAWWSYDRAEAFKAADAPLLVVDTGLVIGDVNPAYLRATYRTEEELLGTPMFEAFPDNPGNPQADGVANLGASFRRVFCDGHRDHMPLQRYDIPVRAAPQAFARRFWNLVNSPLRDNSGRLIGVLHHVEDVTPVADLLLSFGWPSPAGLAVDERTGGLLVAALAREVLAHQQARATVGQLQQALNSRVVIEQAKGVIAGREGISVDEAFARLRRHAREHGAVLSEVARAVVERGLRL